MHDQMRDDIAHSEELMNTARAMKIEAATAQARVMAAQEALDVLVKEAEVAANAASEMQARAEAATAGLSASMTLPPEGRFPTFEDLLESAQQHAAAQGYALSAGRRRKRKDGVRQLIMVQCARGGVYQDRTKPGERKRKANTRKTECEFSFNACQMKEEEGGGWELRYREGENRSKHNHGPTWEKGMTGKWGNRRKIKESEKRAVPGEGRFQVDVQAQQQQEAQQQAQQQQQHQMGGHGSQGAMAQAPMGGPNMPPNNMPAGNMGQNMGQSNIPSNLQGSNLQGNNMVGGHMPQGNMPQANMMPGNMVGSNVDAHGDIERGRDRNDMWRLGGMYQTPSYA